MGTRSLTHVKDETGEILVTMYKQSDGYLESYGLDLATYLSKFDVVNGIRIGEEMSVFNGCGCLAASVIEHFKERAGEYYIYMAGSKNCGEEYTYTITVSEDKEIVIAAEDIYAEEVVFVGTPKEYIEVYRGI